MSDSGFAKKLVKSLKPTKTELKKSAKLEWLEDFVREGLENNGDEQFVIFTRSEKFLRLISERLSFTTVVTLSGDMGAAEREASRLIFTQGDAHVFVLTDAGSRGLNLQCASTLINADVPWNPAVLDQRNGRIIRLGSKHDHVRIINLYSRDSIDERIRDVIYRKSLDTKGFIEKTDEETQEVMRLSKSVVDQLLRRGSN
jgi:SNF2 family DNA or RNA helicase